MASKMGCKSCGEFAIARSTSEMAVCCSCARISSVASCSPVDEIAERLTRLEHRPMKLPLFRLRLDIRCEFPSGHPNPAHSREAASEMSFVLREACEFVIRIGFPVPIGGAFRVVSEFRLALPQSVLGTLLVIDVVTGAI